jgi:hypothetical protein
VRDEDDGHVYGHDTALFLYRLNCEAEGDFIRNIGRTLAHIEVRALDLRGAVSADRIALQHGMRHRLERGHRERHRAGHALDREIAIDRHRLVAVESHRGRGESNRRVFCGVKVIGPLDVFIKECVTSVHRFCINGDVYRTGFCGAVEHDLAAGFIKAMQLFRIAQVVVLKANDRISASFFMLILLCKNMDAITFCQRRQPPTEI